MAKKYKTIINGQEVEVTRYADSNGQAGRLYLDPETSKYVSYRSITSKLKRYDSERRKLALEWIEHKQAGQHPKMKLVKKQIQTIKDKIVAIRSAMEGSRI